MVNNMVTTLVNNMVKSAVAIRRWWSTSGLAFSTGESRFLSTSQVILSIGAVPNPMELPPYPIDSYRLVDAYGLVFIA